MDERLRGLSATYLRLGTGELAAAAVFAGLAAFVLSPRLQDPSDRAALWSAVTPLVVVLAQGGAYWLLARRWMASGSAPSTVAGLYRCFRYADPGLLAAGLVGLVVWWPASLGAGLWLVGIWVFAAAEYANYFVVRLAYPAHRWWADVRRWRTPRLVLDLEQ